MKQEEMYKLLDRNCMEYSRYTIENRAIVDVFDGLKPIHRKIIWSMYLDKLTHDKPRTKSINACGSVLRFSCHGDSSVYDACVRLANDSVMLNLIDGKGAFSTITSRDMDAGASRYTEIRLSPITQELLNNIDKNIVPMVNNYDDTRLEPKVLPATFPTVLANPSLGIATGVASKICSFNLNDIVDNTIKYIQYNTMDILIPDFPTGGLIIKDDNILSNIHNNGRGSITLRAKYHIENNSIIITEIPYLSTREDIIEKTISLVKDGKIKDIIDINDYSGVDGLNITIDVKKNTDMDLLMMKLYKMTPLQSSYSCNFTVLHNDKPKVMGVKTIIQEWLKFRRICVSKGLLYDINIKSKKLHNLKGLEKVLLDIDKCIEIIRKSEEELIIPNLIQSFKIDETQANSIANMKLRNINKNYILKQVNDIQKLEDEINELKTTLNSDDKINQLIISQLEEVKAKYGKPRMTEIIFEEDIEEISADELIEDYSVTLVRTQEGYFKKTRRYSEQQKIKDGDIVVDLIQDTNRNKAIFITNKGNGYILNLWEINDKQPSVLGDFLPSILPLEAEETVLGMITTNDYKGYVLIIYESGKLARIPLESYYTKTNRTKLSNCLADGEVPILISQTNDNCDIELTNSFGKTIIINSNNVNEKKAKNTVGVTVMKSTREGFKVVNAKINK